MEVPQMVVMDASSEADDASMEMGRVYTRVSVHESKEEALCTMELVDGTLFRFLYNYGSRGHVDVYRCTSHHACGKVMRLVASEIDGNPVVLLEGHGDHDEVFIANAKTGAPHCLAGEVDSLLLSRGPKAALKKLNMKFKTNAKIKRLLRTVIQLKTRKAKLRKNMEGGWEITCPAAMNEWACPKMCETPTDYFGAPDTQEFSESLADAMDDLIVLSMFAHDVQTKGGQVKSFGVIFSSRRVFSNVQRAVIGQKSGLLAVTDGTYKLHFGNWTLINFGTYSTRYEKGVYSKHYVPRCYMFVRTELTEAYKALFSTTTRFAKLFYGVDVDVAFGSLDHAWAIANAFRDVWPRITLVTCWPHVVRKTSEQAARLTQASYYDAVIHPHITILHLTRTREQFLTLADVCIRHWRKDGEGAYADWFAEVYLAEPWNSWYIGASGSVSGILPNQNALESYHRSIKATVESLRANTATVLNETLPGILISAGMEPQEGDLRHYAEGPITKADIETGWAMASIKRNHALMRLHDGDTVAAVVFNSDKHMEAVANPDNGVNVTATRVKRYTDSLMGDLVKNKPTTEAELLYQSLHRVTIIRADHPTFECKPKWQSKEIEMIRSSYKCDCKVSRQTGWICAHIIATLSLLKKLSISDQLSLLPIKKRPGGQYKSRGPLMDDSDRSATRFFIVTRLIDVLLRGPASAQGWQVVKEFAFGVGRRATKEHCHGRVVRWIENGGRYQWRIEFSHRVVEIVEVEELAELFCYSHRRGLRVVP